LDVLDKPASLYPRFDLGCSSAGSLPNRCRQMELTTAVVEFSTWAMMILGFVGVGFLAYRRRGITPALPGDRQTALGRSFLTWLEYKTTPERQRRSRTK
jgi:hypothetical protein